MPLDFDPTRPIYLQIIEAVKKRTVRGQYNAGEQLLSVREMAKEMGVPSLGALPLDPRIVVGGDAGTPAVTQLAPGDPVYDAFDSLAKRVAQVVAEAGDTPELKITR